MLRRFADRQIRAELDRTRRQRDNYRALAHAFAARLREARADLAALNQEKQQ